MTPKTFTTNDPKIFDIPTPDAAQLLALDGNDITGCQVKTYKTKDMLEVEIFPTWNTNTHLKRAPRQKSTRKAQENVNDRHSWDYFVRKVYANFSHGDTFLTLTHARANLPADEVSRHFSNYIRTLKRRFKAATGQDLKYMATTEYTATGHAHHHIFINVADRNLLESLWRHGRITESRRINTQHYDHAPVGLALYCTHPERKLEENPTTRNKGSHRWTCSKNLKEPPKPTRANKKLSKREVAKLARTPADIQSKLEKLYPGYTVADDGRDIAVRYSSFVSGAYIKARLYAIPPPETTERKCHHAQPPA